MLTLIDTGPIVAYYNAKDEWHKKVQGYFETFTGQFVTTCPVISEAMYLLRTNHLVQNVLLGHLSRGLYDVVALDMTDYARISELNLRYRDLPGDFADLSLVAVAERLDIVDIASLDGDFEIYRRYRSKKFNQVFPRHGY